MLFPCLTDNRVHLLGIDLKIRGLAFQEQDLGVSACATTALWSSLQKFHDFEDIGSVSPARITMLASQYALPFGRSMPSEGLSLDQMCQAVSALGVAPNLYKATGYAYTRSLIFAAVSSGLPPVLIIHDPPGVIFHAVTAVGMGLHKPRRRTSPIAPDFVDDPSGDLQSLYIHDDRIGPYLKARPKKNRKSFTITIETEDRLENWTVSHILIPMHPKIRLSFGSLHVMARNLVAAVQAFRELIGTSRPSLITQELRIELSHRYIRRLLKMESELEIKTVEAFVEQVPLPRYVGVVRIKADTIDPIDFILDCTSTESNPLALAALAMGSRLPETEAVTGFVAEWFGCWALAQ